MWWQWCIAGIVLAALEIFTPTSFFLLLFGLAAILVALVTALGISAALWLQFLLFGVFATLLLVGLRKSLLQKFASKGATQAVDPIVGEQCLSLGEIACNQQGQVDFRGTPWNAKNIGERALMPQERCRIEKRDGLVLLVRNL